MPKFSEQVIKKVEDLAVAENARLTIEKVALQDELDAAYVFQSQAVFNNQQQRLVPIVEQLRAFSQRNFPIQFARNYRRGLSHSNGTIELDFATLRKPTSELILTIAHEWAHQCLDHFNTEMTIYQRETAAEYWGGIFLGFYDSENCLDEIVKIKLSMPELEPDHGSQYERACLVVQGYQEGAHLKQSTEARFWPGLEAFRSQHGPAPWEWPTTEQAQEVSFANNDRKLSK